MSVLEGPEINKKKKSSPPPPPKKKELTEGRGEWEKGVGNSLHCLGHLPFKDSFDMIPYCAIYLFTF